MNRQEALGALRNGSPHARLKAARHLARDPNPADAAALRNARVGEADVYVKAALDRAIAVAEQRMPAWLPSEPSDVDEISDETRREVYAQAVRWIAGTLLHEIAAPIGLIELAAVRDIGKQYEGSATQRRIRSVQQTFAAIEALQTAATPAKPQQFDLAEFVKEIIYEVVNGSGRDVSRHGPSPLMIHADPRLLRLAFINGLKNALEAVQQIELPDAESPVVVSWGSDDTDVWIAVVDSGPGLSGPIEKAFEIGQTTKKDSHRGFGLAIARQAMESLGGAVRLTGAAAGGVSYEIRWEQ